LWCDRLVGDESFYLLSSGMSAAGPQQLSAM
jgi:hypothetical protein